MHPTNDPAGRRLLALVIMSASNAVNNRASSLGSFLRWARQFLLVLVGFQLKRKMLCVLPSKRISISKRLVQIPPSIVSVSPIAAWGGNVYFNSVIARAGWGGTCTLSFMAVARTVFSVAQAPSVMRPCSDAIISSHGARGSPVFV